MAKLNTKEIRERAKEILEGSPQGLRFTKLWHQIAEEHPDTNQNTIFTQVSNLAKDESATVTKPSRGVYQLVKYAELHSEKNDGAAENNSKSAGNSFQEDSFYGSFAAWLRDELVVPAAQSIPYSALCEPV